MRDYQSVEGDGEFVCVCVVNERGKRVGNVYGCVCDSVCVIVYSRETEREREGVCIRCACVREKERVRERFSSLSKTTLPLATQKNFKIFNSRFHFLQEGIKH